MNEEIIMDFVRTFTHLLIAFTAGMMFADWRGSPGDMNEDGRLTLTDVSILAAKINPQ